MCEINKSTSPAGASPGKLEQNWVIKQHLIYRTMFCQINQELLDQLLITAFCTA